MEARSSTPAVDVWQARWLAQAGRLSMENLLDLLDELDRLRGLDQQTIRSLSREIDRLKERLAQYEPDITAEPTPTKIPPKAIASKSRSHCSRRGLTQSRGKRMMLRENGTRTRR